MLESVDQFIQTTMGHVPLAALTIALLATPTILYVIYRLSQPTASHGRPKKSHTPIAQWVCPRCHSVNDLQSNRCYRCSFAVDDATDLLVIDPLTAKPIPIDTPETIPVDRPAVPVGPGPARPGPAMPAPAATRPGAVPPAANPATPPARPPVAPTTVPGAPGSPGVPVGPGKPVASPSTVTTSIGGAVGARRPFDPVPTPAPKDTSQGS